jgi:hypothetical protein
MVLKVGRTVRLNRVECRKSLFDSALVNVALMSNVAQQDLLRMVSIRVRETCLDCGRGE